VQKFNETIKQIKKRAEAYLDFKANTGLTEDNHNLKYWRNKRLVDNPSWGYVQSEYKLKDMLKYMPEKFERDPLNLRTNYQGEYIVEYDNWLWDYMDYLIQICKEPEEGLWDKISG